ncbi:hypothetical protein PYCCODRAFT_23790 [Trametes coccinea BRFM310]|uniref:Uncharacterized protein n=1 Tax=Trametes coccinea (strain BRFM310) TaxID=1353009 RepID=A0A1Y2J6G2_TRAC3|nr:hypothetical protein PYCCODRAFT_23790 [Trametes coccinea BRFM310]
MRLELQAVVVSSCASGCHFASAEAVIVPSVVSRSVSFNDLPVGACPSLHFSYRQHMLGSSANVVSGWLISSASCTSHLLHRGLQRERGPERASRGWYGQGTHQDRLEASPNKCLMIRSLTRWVALLCIHQ